MPKKRRIVVVSNRLPASRVGTGVGARWQTGAGGLVTALAPIVQATKGQWVGWFGGVGRAPRAITHEGMKLRPVGMTASEVSAFYHGFSNRTLWPLFHDAIRTPEFNHAWWDPYVQVNKRFARAAAKAAGPNDAVWVQDYHLMLVPAMLRAIRPELRIGFFMHIPFPPEELFSWLPWRQELLEGLLGADVIGFQTHQAAQNFARLAKRFTDAEGAAGGMDYQDRRVVVRDFPISIDFDWFDAQAKRPEVIREADQIRKRIGYNRKIFLAVDRLDYTKGIDFRMRAFELFLKRSSSVEECVLIQIASPSREQVREYEEMRTRIDRLVGSINGEFSEPGRVAVHYFRRTLSREELAAYYRAADVMLVTPLRDGMNLVAKEYIASRSDTGGVLVLSEFAGAAEQLRTAILVNPRDIEGMADSFQEAMRMRKGDARFRMAILRSMVKRHDVHEWAREYLGVLCK